MSGRHRKKPAGWSLPVGLGVTIGVGLAATVYLAGGPEPQTDTITAALVLRPPTTSTSTSASPAPMTPEPTPLPTTPVPVPTQPAPAPQAAAAAPPPPVAKKTTTRQPPPATSCSSTLDGTRPHVAQVGNHIKAKFGVKDIGGVAGRGGVSDHPSGLALDFMVDTATGNAVADYVLANRQAFGVTYVIWRQRYNDGGGWSAMENRGSATANHLDHVHVSFKPAATVTVTC
jgi:hypothetical protein